MPELLPHKVGADEVIPKGTIILFVHIFDCSDNEIVIEAIEALTTFSMRKLWREYKRTFKPRSARTTMGEIKKGKKFIKWLTETKKVAQVKTMYFTPLRG